MATIERDVVLTSKVGDSESIDLPITRLGNIEDGADTKSLLSDGDYLPILDSADKAYMKKTLWSNVKTALKSYFDGLYSSITHTHTTDSLGAAPTSHASSSATYGIGTGSNYGHVKLSDSTSSTSGASSGVAACPSAVKSAYDLANAAKTESNKAAKLSTARTIRTNLASTSTASFDGSGNITPGVTGTLPIANGGTGAASALEALTALGAASITTYTATITTSWSGSGPYTQTVNISGITAEMSPIVDVMLSSTAATARLQAEAWGMVSKIVTGDGNITVTCLDDKPTTAIPIQLKVVM